MLRYFIADKPRQQAYNATNMTQFYWHLRLRWLFLWATLVPAAQAGLGIPGTTQTTDGYDTELGTDAICWKSYGQILSTSSASDNSLIALPNPLVDDYYVEGAVNLLTACPTGNSLTAEAPPESLRGERLRTGSTYQYSVGATLNLTSLWLESNLAQSNHSSNDNLSNKDDPIYELLTQTKEYDNTNSYVAVQIVICVLGETGFCSPYIHEEANARLSAANFSLKVAKGDRHGDTHVHSGFSLIQLPHTPHGIHVIHPRPISMRINDPGTFFAIASLQLYLRAPNNNYDERRIVRYDLANALFPRQYRLVRYQDPAVILRIPGSIRAVSYLAVTVAALTILYLLQQTIQHRHHQVLRLTQGPFLIVFLLAALVATLSCVTLDPQWHSCRISHSLLLVSLQLMYAVTWGRLWRIHSVISPLLLETMRSQQQSCATQFMNGLTAFTAVFGGNREDDRSCCCWTPKASSGSTARSGAIRRQVTAMQLTIVIALFTIPQLLLQILVVAVQPPETLTELNADESKGREICDANVSTEFSLLSYGYLLFVLLVLLLLFIAQATKTLPSLFNETSVIFESSLSTAVLLMLAFGIYIVTDDPETSPGLAYMIWILLILSTTLNATIRILLPKLRMVWNDETVIVSKLVSDNRDATNAGSHSQATSSYVMNDHTDRTWGSDTFRSRYNASQVENTIENSSPDDENDDHVEALTENGQVASGEVFPDQNGVVVDDAKERDAETKEEERPKCISGGSTVATTTNSPVTRNASTTSSGGMVSRNSSIPTTVDVDTSNDIMYYQSDHLEAPGSSGGQPRRKRATTIPIQLDETPSKRLVLKMVHLQSQLAKVNERICSGLGVTRDEWTQLRSLSTRVGHIFSDQVVFEWEEQQPLQRSQPTAAPRPSQSPQAPQSSLSIVAAVVPEQRQPRTHSETTTRSSSSRTFVVSNLTSLPHTGTQPILEEPELNSDP